MSRKSLRLGREALLRQRPCRRRRKTNRTDRRFPLRNHRSKVRRRNPPLRNPSRGNPSLNSSLPCRSTLLRDLLLRNLLLRRSPPRHPILRNVPRCSHLRRCLRPGNVPCKRPPSWTLSRRNPSSTIVHPRRLPHRRLPGRIRFRWTRSRWGLRRRRRPRRAAFHLGSRGRPFTTRAPCTAGPGTRSSGRRSGALAWR